MAMRLLVLFCLTMAVGCFSNRPDLDFGKVEGTVTYKGEPVENATVRFQPESGRPSYGKTNSEGYYSMKFMGEDWGALAGKNQVAITTEDRIEDMETGQVTMVREFLPKKYHAESTLTADVEKGKNVIDFHLD